MKYHGVTCSLLAIAISAHLPLASADWQFKSRPDLAPSRLNITIAATSDVEKGYLFLAPFAGLADTATEQHGPRQAGPYIFRDNGDLVWLGYGYFSIWAAKLPEDTMEWQGHALYGHGHGHVTVLDQHYETIRELRAGNHKLMDKHEFHIINEQTAVVQIYQPVARDLTKWGASPEQQWIVNTIFQELDLTTGKPLFKWSSLDHASPSESVLPINPGQAGSGFNSSDAWDYFHINSVTKTPQINGTSDEFIWRLDGNKSDFRLGQGIKFCFQHHARFVSQDGDEEVISLYDNAAHGPEMDVGMKFALYRHFLARLSSSTPARAVTEFRADGTPIFHAYMDSGYLGEAVENYRGYRYSWTGLPNKVPSIVLLGGESGDTTAYVSWNGDTETTLWRFFSVTDEVGSRSSLGEVKRKSFETKSIVKGAKIDKIGADAVHADGKVLTTSGVAIVESAVEPPKPLLRTATLSQ